MVHVDTDILMHKCVEGAEVHGGWSMKDWWGWAGPEHAMMVQARQKYGEDYLLARFQERTRDVFYLDMESAGSDEPNSHK